MGNCIWRRASDSVWNRDGRERTGNPSPLRAKLRLLAKQTVRLHLNIINGGERGSRLLCCDEGREGRPLWLGRLCKVCGWTTTCLFMCLGGNEIPILMTMYRKMLFLTNPLLIRILKSGEFTAHYYATLIPLLAFIEKSRSR